MQDIEKKVDVLEDLAGRIVKRNEELFRDYKRSVDMNTELEALTAKLRSGLVEERMRKQEVLDRVDAALSRLIASIADSGPRRLVPMCCVCLQEEVRVLVDACGHLCMCRECAEKVYETTAKCPMCNGKLEKATNVFFP